MLATSSAGAQANQVHLAGRRPLPQAVLHQAIGQELVDAKERCYRDRQSHCYHFHLH
jgi:hypothetical protein